MVLIQPIVRIRLVVLRQQVIQAGKALRALRVGKALQVLQVGKALQVLQAEEILIPVAPTIMGPRADFLRYLRLSKN